MMGSFDFGTCLQAQLRPLLKGPAPLTRASLRQYLRCGTSVTKAHEVTSTARFQGFRAACSCAAAQGFVRGVTMSPDGRKAFSCGDDKARPIL